MNRAAGRRNSPPPQNFLKAVCGISVVSQSLRLSRRLEQALEGPATGGVLRRIEYLSPASRAPPPVNGQIIFYLGFCVTVTR